MQGFKKITFAFIIIIAYLYELDRILIDKYCFVRLETFSKDGE